MKIYFYSLKLNYRLIIFCIAIICTALILFLYTHVKATSFNKIKLPIISYHSVLKSHKDAYTISPSQLAEDFKYIKEKGYTTIVVEDLINYIYYDIPLPQKPIMITFDDGYYNNYFYAVPLLEKYDMKAVISIIGKYTEDYSKKDETNINYSYLKWRDINELISEGIIEFQNHSYNLHSASEIRKGITIKQGETYELYKKVLEEDIMKLQDKFQENCGYIPTTFTYPFGLISKESVQIIKEFGFKASFSCANKLNYISKDPECLFLLNRFNRLGRLDTYVFFKNILD